MNNSESVNPNLLDKRVSCSDHEIESIKAVYKICIETRNFEINQLIQRNNFFMLFQGVLLAAALQNQASKPLVELIICVAGIAVSIYQLQMASGAKFWQEWWESRVDQYESKLRSMKLEESGHFHDLFDVPFADVHQVVSGRLHKQGRYSLINSLILMSFAVGRAPIKVSIVLALTWTALLLHTVDLSAVPHLANYVKGFTFALPPK